MPSAVHRMPSSAALVVSWGLSSACLAEGPPKQGPARRLTRKGAIPLVLQLELPGRKKRNEGIPASPPPPFQSLRLPLDKAEGTPASFP